MHCNSFLHRRHFFCRHFAIELPGTGDTPYRYSAYWERQRLVQASVLTFFDRYSQVCRKRRRGRSRRAATAAAAAAVGYTRQAKMGEFQRWNTHHSHVVPIEVCGHQLNIAQVPDLAYATKHILYS